jgi:hypothetical protein
MRVAVIVIGIAVVSTPSYASKSCMTMTEARQAFGQVHLYWHGDHCWDASAGQHGFIHRTRHSDVKQAQRGDPEPKDEPKIESKNEPEDQLKDQRKNESKGQGDAQPPKWRDAMSEMLPFDAPVFRNAPVFRSAAAAPMEGQSELRSPGLNWLDRWVDVVQVFPRIHTSHAAATAARPTRFEPLVTPVRVLLAFLAIALTIGVIEILFRSTIHEYRK